MIGSDGAAAIRTAEQNEHFRLPQRGRFPEIQATR
jgi:hypothetical protein